jgi:hypothetical protein
VIVFGIAYGIARVGNRRSRQGNAPE